MIHDDNNYYQINDIYRTENNRRNKKHNSHINKEKITIVILIIIIFIALCYIAVHSFAVIQESMKQQQYEQEIIKAKEERERQQKEKEEEQKRKEEEKRQEALKKAEEERQKRIPKLTEVGRQNMENIYKSETKRAFLTFDDGPSTVTETILNTLKQENVPATFFVLGSRVEAMPDMVKKIYEEGHYIANHGYSHQYSSIYQTPQSVLNEYNQCNDAVKNAIGVPEYNSHLFRFPGGFPGGPYVDVKTQAKELLSQNDILYVDWNSLSGDAETSSPTIEYEMNRIKATTANRNSLVILLHDAQAKKATADALPQIIGYLKEQGYEFKNFYDIIK